MKYVTVAMIAEHADKCPASVPAALKAAGVKPEKLPGVKGVRIPERDANKFLLRHWPDVGAMPATSN
jgi:hypothetical protein